MRSFSSWLPCVGYAAMALSGAAFAERANGTIVVMTGAAREAPTAASRALLGIAGALLLARLTVHGSRVLVARTRWARRLHAGLRGVWLGASGRELALVSGLAAISEELFFRAALGPAIGFVASSALFGVAHLASRDSSLPWVLCAFAMGLLFSGLYVLSGTLLAPIFAHWLINYENMQYICSYDPTPVDIDRISVRSGYSSDR
jgi:membrane protease YdiL (CAAX protease family)